MKKMFIGLLVACTTYTYAQEANVQQDREMQTLIKEGAKVGGFLAFEMKGTEINDQTALFTGGRLSMVAGHKINIGFGGYGLVSDVNSNYLDDEGERYLYEMGYGGLIIEPVAMPYNVVHVTFPVLLGAGGIGVHEQRFFDYNSGNTSQSESFEFRDSDFFLVVEPGINAEMNIARILRFGVGASYRLTSDTELLNQPNTSLDGMSVNLAIKIGWF